MDFSTRAQSSSQPALEKPTSRGISFFFFLHFPRTWIQSRTCRLLICLPCYLSHAFSRTHQFSHLRSHHTHFYTFIGCTVQFLSRDKTSVDNHKFFPVLYIFWCNVIFVREAFVFLGVPIELRYYWRTTVHPVEYHSTWSIRPTSWNNEGVRRDSTYSLRLRRLDHSFYIDVDSELFINAVLTLGNWNTSL